MLYDTTEADVDEFVAPDPRGRGNETSADRRLSAGRELLW
jgi:hypothetical protein